MRSTKRFIAVAIATGLVSGGSGAAIPASALAAPEPLARKPGVYRVTTQAVRTHSGPGSTYGVTGVHKAGMLLAASGRNSKGWTEVFLSTGGSAWIKSVHLTRATGTVYKVQAQPGANFRSGPGTNFRQKGFLKHGVIVPGTGNTKRKWAQLLLSSGELVWASTRYIVLMNATLTAPAHAGPPAADAPEDPPKEKRTR
ncbi:hypothetical protein SMC26_00910 [Actinomadura fulvescens]